MKINFMANVFIKNDLILSYCLFASFHNKRVFIQQLMSETVVQVVETVPVKQISFNPDIKNRDDCPGSVKYYNYRLVTGKEISINFLRF